MAVTKRTRFEVLKRDNHACRYCGIAAPEVVLTVDHVVPIALGGSDDPSNLVAACRDCNYGKASTAPDAKLIEDVKQADLIWADALRRATEIRMAERDKRMDYLRSFASIWYSNTPADWEQSVEHLYACGLSVTDLEDAAHVAQTAKGVWTDPFTYFCGVAWKRIRQDQETARALLEADNVQEVGE